MIRSDPLYEEVAKLRIKWLLVFQLNIESIGDMLDTEDGIHLRVLLNDAIETAFDAGYKYAHQEKTTDT